MTIFTLEWQFPWQHLILPLSFYDCDCFTTHLCDVLLVQDRSKKANNNLLGVCNTFNNYTFSLFDHCCHFNCLAICSWWFILWTQYIYIYYTCIYRVKLKDYFLWDQDKDKEEKKDRDKKDKDKEIKVPKKKEEAPKKKEEVIKKKEDKLKWKRKKMVPSGNKAEQSIAILYLSHNDPYRYILTKMSLKIFTIY